CLIYVNNARNRVSPSRSLNQLRVYGAILLIHVKARIGHAATMTLMYRCGKQAGGNGVVDASKCCVVVADARRARILLSQPENDGRTRLIEHAELLNHVDPVDAPLTMSEHISGQAGPGCPQVQRRGAHRLEINHRFAAEVAAEIANTVSDWQAGSIVVTAAPGMLGLLHELVQAAVPAGIAVKALAKDYVALSASELTQRIALR
ncbi:MAG: host attachment protein, partial [Burkholderiales bacterium]